MKLCRIKSRAQNRVASKSRRNLLVRQDVQLGEASVKCPGLAWRETKAKTISDSW